MLGDKIERKLWFIKIPNLAFILVVVSVFVYLVDYVSFLQGGQFFLNKLLYFDKTLILRGQIWRAIGFVFTGLNSSLLFALLQAYFLYFLGTCLEVNVGERRFSLFYIFGVIFLIIGGFLTGTTTILYLNMTMFFAFATINPNRKFLLFFFLPVKTIWLGVFDGVYFLINLIVALIRRDIATVLAILGALASFLIFFGPRFFIDIYKQIKSLQQNSKRMYESGSYWGT